MVYPVASPAAYARPNTSQLTQPIIKRPVQNTPEARVAWHAIAPVGIFPMGNKIVPVSADLLDNGQLVTETVAGPQVQGQLDTLGNYQLVNGIRGNLFENSWLQMNLSDASPNPFLTALRATERRRAVTGSEIPRIRQLLTNRGLTGAGIKIGILDPKEKDPKNGTLIQSSHTRLVSAIINDPVWGVAPGAQVEDVGGPEVEGDLKLATDSYEAFSNTLVQEYRTMMMDRIHLLDSLIAKRDPALRVLNATWGDAQNKVYLDVLSKILLKQDENGYYKYPTLRQAIFHPTLGGTKAEKLQAVVNAVDAILANNAVVQVTKAQYVEATHRATNAGLILVGAAANEGEFDLPGISWKAGAQMDFFTESPYVIRVAAANTRQQPGNRAAYKVADFSSRGDGQSFNPTIAAPGEEMGFSFPQGKIAHNLVEQGTSFSTPFVCGVIALMLQRNPWLTFEQVKARLQATAVQAPGYGPADYGAGFVNAEAAVLS